MLAVAEIGVVGVGVGVVVGVVEEAMEEVGPTRIMLVDPSTKAAHTLLQQCPHMAESKALSPIHVLFNTLYCVSRSRRCGSCRYRIVSCVDIDVATL